MDKDAAKLQEEAEKQPGNKTVFSLISDDFIFLSLQTSFFCSLTHMVENMEWKMAVLFFLWFTFLSSNWSRKS